MNEINSNGTTSSFFESREQYMAFRAAWAKACHDKEICLTATDYALYAILRGRRLESQFSPITNRVKLENGQDPMGAKKWSMAILKSAFNTFNGVSRMDKLLSIYGETVSSDTARTAINYCYNRDSV